MYLLDGFVHLYLKQITLLIHLKNVVFKPLFKAQKWRFPLSLQFISSSENSWVTAAQHRPGTLGCCQPSSVAKARDDPYMKILRLFSKNFHWPKQLHYSCKFVSCSCLVGWITNCLHPPSHPSPTTMLSNKIYCHQILRAILINAYYENVKSEIPLFFYRVVQWTACKSRPLQSRALLPALVRPLGGSPKSDCFYILKYLK